MMFGKSQFFAIELELSSNSAGVWMYGRACYWISGERIGDFDLIDSLRDVLFCWERMSYDQDRFNEELSHLDTQELITTLACGLYSVECVDQDTYQRRAIEGTWDRHNIDPGTIAFSGWNLFLVETDSVARCLYARSDGPRLIGREQKLQLGEFNQILDDAIAYLLREYKRFGGN